MTAAAAVRRGCRSSWLLALAALAVAACGGVTTPRAGDGRARARLRPERRPRAALHRGREGRDRDHGVRLRHPPAGLGPGRAQARRLRARRARRARHPRPGDRARAGHRPRRDRRARRAPARRADRPAARSRARATSKAARVGVSGLPSDPAFLRAIVEHDGGDYRSVRQVTIGFSAVSRLLTRSVDAVPAFWNAEGVALAHAGSRCASSASTTTARRPTRRSS